MQRNARRSPGQAGRKSRKSKPSLQVGLEVEARFKGASSFYPGRIETLNTDGTVDIAYDDGDRESGVPKEFIRNIRTNRTNHQVRSVGSMDVRDTFSQELTNSLCMVCWPRNRPN